MLLNIVASFFIISNPLLVLTSQAFFADHDRTANLAVSGSANISVLAGENGTLPDEEQTKPQFIAAQANPDFLPIRDWSYEDPAIECVICKSFNRVDRLCAELLCAGII